MKPIKFRAWRARYNALGGKMYSHEELLKIGDWKNLFEGNSVLGVLMQSIGLKDYYGKEIYSGDLMNLKDKENKNIGEVRFNEELASFKLKTHNSIFELHEADEVIGNIYETRNNL